MEQNPTRRELLDQHVVTGRLTEAQADAISDAPPFSFRVRELVSYLAGIIITVGVVRVLSVAFEDASQTTVEVALYVAAALTAAVSWRLHDREGIVGRLAEFLEVASVGLTMGATGLVLDQAGMQGDWIALSVFAAGAVWGAWRCRVTGFAGTIVLSVGLIGAAIAGGSIIDSDGPTAPGAVLEVAAWVLIAVGLTVDIGSRFVARATGAWFAAMAGFMLGGDIDWGKPIPIVVGAGLFALGASTLHPEFLVAGAIAIVVGVVMTVGEYVHNDMAQGLVIIATGLVMLVVLSAQMRRAVNRPAPGRPAA